MLIMPKDKKPHDTFFKHHFSHQEAIEGFLRNRLPKALVETVDFTTLKKQPDSFLPTDYLGRRQVDVLWSVSTKDGEEIDFFMHFEAEGTPQEMAMRVLMYQAIIGDTFLKQNKGSKIPTIITFVLYHGRQPWVGAKSIAGCYKNYKQQSKYGFEAPFVIDLRNEKKEAIMADGKIASPEFALAGQAKGDMFAYFREAIAMSPLPCCEKALIYYYLLVNRGKEQQLFEELRKFNPSKANQYRIMLETLKQTFIDEGVQKGVQNTLRLVGTILKSRGLKQDFIQGVTHDLQQSVSMQDIQ